MTTGTGRVFSTLSGEVVATNVSEEEYMARYAAHYCEWVGGTVIKMAPVGLRHDMVFQYLIVLLQTYFAFRPVGAVRAAPFLMRLTAIAAKREPDLQVILNENQQHVSETAMNAPADICIEIVSLESVERDYGDKFREYETAVAPQDSVVIRMPPEMPI